MARDVSHLFLRYRECVRALWPRYWHPDLGWDERDFFEDACVPLFRGMVMYPLALQHVALLPSYRTEAPTLECFQVRPDNPSRVLVNRDLWAEKPAGGNWDWVWPGDFHPSRPPDLRFIAYFDWDKLKATREYAYLQCMIVDCDDYPESVGRLALVPSDQASVFFHEIAA